jgi:RNA polymerase sigma factor (sigma-70 family)
MASERAGAMVRHLQRLVETETQRGWSDGQLLQRFALHHEEEAFAVLVRRHGRLVWGVCRHVLHHEHDAEDAFQATFLVLARRAAAVRKLESIGSWLHGVAYRIAVRAKQTAAKRQRREQRAAVPEGTLAVPDLAWRELQALLDEEVARLPEKYRAPFVLCCLEGRSRTEAAAELAVPKGTVSSRIAHARQLLQERLARRGVTLSAVLTAGVLWGGSASAAVPTALARITVVAAVGQTSGGFAPAVAALANGAVTRLGAGKLFVSLALLLTAAVLGVVGYRLSAALPGPDPQPEQADNKPSAAPPERLDQHGDPLPPEALTRLGTARFWCGGNGQTQVAFTPDGGTILAAHWLGVFVMDASTGKQFRHISTSATKRTVNSMSVSPDGKQLALGTDSSADNPCSIQIWDLTTGQLQRECKDTGRQQYLHVRFSPDGKMLASYSFPSKTIYLWDPATGREIRRWLLASEAGGCLTFSPDSKTLIVGELRTVHFWDIATGKEVRRIVDHPGGCVYRLTLAQDGKVLATQALTEEPKIGEPHHREHNVHLWDVTTGMKIRHIAVAADSSTKHARRNPDFSEMVHFQFSPDTKVLATASGDGVVRVWDVATGKERCRWDTSEWVGGFAFSPDGKTLASISANIVRLWDPVAGKELREHPSHRHGFQVLALSPDGRTLASAGWDQDVRLWNPATGQQQLRLTADGNVHAIRFSAGGRTLTTLGDDGKARMWDVAAGKERRQFPMPIEGRGWRHVLSPDGKTWASASEDTQNHTTNLVLWDAATGLKRQVCVGHEGWIGALAFSLDSGTLYSWGGNKRVRVWEVATGKRLREFAAGAEQGVYTGGFSPDGNWFACASRGQALVLYDMATGMAVRRIEVPAMRYDNRTLAISPDSRTLAVGDEDGTIHLLELASGKFRRRLVGGHQGSISALLFSMDGKRLVSGSADTTALVWDLTGRLSAPRTALSAADLDACWTDLAGEDAERAYQSIRRLAASPTETLPYLGKKLQPAASADARRVARLITDLDSDQFIVREQASKELEKLGEAATAACRQALASKPSPELRRRLEMLLAKQEQERWSPSPERLRLLRTLEALEVAGTPKARRLLQKLASGAPGAYLTREAQAALARLTREPGMNP